jgi:hypothetical protein
MNSDEISRVFARIERLRDEGKLPQIDPSMYEDEPTALAFTPYDNGFHISKPNAYYRRDDLYRAFLAGHKMGLLEIDELQLDAEFIIFKEELDNEDDGY